MGFGDDGVGEWSQLKLQYLSSYLSCFTKATARAMHRYYIDGFAGKGKWPLRNSKKEIKGSPLIALDTEPRFTKCFFIEKNQDNVNNLIKVSKEYSNREFEVIVGDCNVKMKDVLEVINKRAPTFVFLDPTAGHLSWETIELLSQWQTELFINFPLHMDLLRNLPNNRSKLKKRNEDKLNMVFGGQKWKGIYDRKFALSGARFSSWNLMELYITGLKELGYSYINYSDVIKNSSGQKLYYMIWAGKHQVGGKIINYVLKRQFKEQLDIHDFL